MTRHGLIGEPSGEAQHRKTPNEELEGTRGPGGGQARDVAQQWETF